MRDLLALRQPAVAGAASTAPLFHSEDAAAYYIGAAQRDCGVYALFSGAEANGAIGPAAYHELERFPWRSAQHYKRWFLHEWVSRAWDGDVRARLAISDLIRPHKRAYRYLHDRCRALEEAFEKECAEAQAHKQPSITHLESEIERGTNVCKSAVSSRPVPSSLKACLRAAGDRCIRAQFGKAHRGNS